MNMKRVIHIFFPQSEGLDKQPAARRGGGRPKKLLVQVSMTRRQIINHKYQWINEHGNLNMSCRSTFHILEYKIWNIFEAITIPFWQDTKTRKDITGEGCHKYTDYNVVASLLYTQPNSNEEGQYYYQNMTHHQSLNHAHAQVLRPCHHNRTLTQTLSLHQTQNNAFATAQVGIGCLKFHETVILREHETDISCM